MSHRRARRAQAECASVDPGRHADDVVALLLCRRGEVTGDLVELGIRRLEWMFSREVASTQARFANLVGNIEVVQAMGCPGFLVNAASPSSRSDGVRGEIEHDRRAGCEECLNVTGHRIAQPAGTANVVGDGLNLVRVQTCEPVVLADEDRLRLRC